MNKENRQPFDVQVLCQLPCSSHQLFFFSSFSAATSLLLNAKAPSADVTRSGPPERTAASCTNGTNDASKGRYGLIAPIAWDADWPVIGDGTPFTSPIEWP